MTYSVSPPSLFKMELDRGECLEVLEVLGIELPKESKLPLEVLQRRVKKALEATQPSLKAKKIDPSELKKWKSTSEKSLLEATKTINMMEASQNQARTLITGEQRPPTLFIDPFIDLRQSVMAFGMNCENGLRVGVIEDPAGNYSFTIRVVDIYEITDGVPLFVVLYEHGAGSVHARETANRFMASQPKHPPAFLIKCNTLEQKLWLELLDSNSKALLESYTVEKTAAESNHRLSAFVPPNPLGFRDIGTFTNDSGCIICGSPIRSRCAQCQSVSYCGKDCQTAHWKTHRRMCKSLAGGTWMPVNVTLPSELGPYILTINRFSTKEDIKNMNKDNCKTNDELPNVHGDRVFIAKIQASLEWSPGEPSIQIYDRRRSFTVFVKKDAADRSTFDTIFKICRQDGYMGSKIYRWMKRTGDKTFSVCLDRSPTEDIKW